MANPHTLRALDAPVSRMRLPDKGYSRHLVTPDDGAGNAHVLISVLAPGGPTAPYHLHQRSEATYVVLRGQVEVLIGDRSYRLGADEVAFVPPGVGHALGNPADVEAHVLSVYAPSARDDFHLVDPPANVAGATTVRGVR